jgi:hypothetical protein
MRPNVCAQRQTPLQMQAGHSHPKDILSRMPRAPRTELRAFVSCSA